MKKILLSILYIVLTIHTNAQDITQVLFIGNSITYFNDMPQTFRAIANDMGDITEITEYAPGGTGFIHHVVDPNVYHILRTGIWDYVVLQPGSNESAGYSEPIEQTTARAKTLRDSIIHYNPCAEILYYEISYGVWGSTPADLDTYNTTMDLIRANIEYLADSTSSSFAPAGEAMRTAWNSDQTNLLWGSVGDIHPNAKGSYIIACSMYAAIFQKATLGTSITNLLPPSEAASYQLLVDTTVLHNLSDWRINTYSQITDFSYTLDQFNAAFVSTSQNIDSLDWDFGDGTSSKLPSPIHNYAQSGSYTVTLTSYKGNCMETISKTIDILTVSLDDQMESIAPVIYPNPFTDKLIIKNSQHEVVSIYNLLGQEFTQSIAITVTKEGLIVDTSMLQKGYYVIKTKGFTQIMFKE